MIKIYFEKIEKLRLIYFYLDWLLIITKSLILGLLMMSVWQWLHPFQKNESFFAGLLVALLVTLWSIPKRPKKISTREAVLGLEIKHPHTKLSPLDVDPELAASMTESNNLGISGDKVQILNPTESLNQTLSNPFDRSRNGNLAKVFRFFKLKKADERKSSHDQPQESSYPSHSSRERIDQNQFTKDSPANNNSRRDPSRVSRIARQKDFVNSLLTSILGSIKKITLDIKELNINGLIIKILDLISGFFHKVAHQFSKIGAKKSTRTEQTAISTPIQVQNNRNGHQEWAEVLSREWRLVQQLHRVKIQSRLTALVLPVCLILIFYKYSSPSFSSTFESLKGLVRNLSRGSRIEIVQGRSDAGGPAVYELGGEAPEIHLLDENLLQLFLDTGNQQDLPIIQLVKLGDSDQADQADQAKQQNIQTFLATPVRNPENGQIQNGMYSLGFSTPQSADLFIPSLFGEKKLARLDVRSSPVPKISLSIAQDNPPDPWPDEELLPLQIRADGINPLKSITLFIHQGKNESRETVANILKETEFTYSNQYRLNLSTFMESDLAEIEITAEATDRASPKPLIGVSKTLKINVASAYGRYQLTLQKLKSVKNALDEAVNSKGLKLDASTLENMQEADQKSHSSPYFDSLDRLEIAQMANDLKTADNNKSLTTFIQVGAKLSDFLYDHESLDDRERDRDFYVAVRALSRMIELDANSRPAPIGHIKERILKFLDQRTDRWKKRLSRLPPELAPKTSNDIIKKMPFHTAIEESSTLANDKPDQTSRSLQQLSQTAGRYRDWLDALESAENKARELREQNRQQAVANAENKLRELQKNQSKILNLLDKADTRTNEVRNNWPEIADEQKSNAGKTSALVPEIAQVSPDGARRLEMAEKAMNQALAAGGEQNFNGAESQADLAGRLLNDSQRSLQQQTRNSDGRESRKRRRVTGDNYFGQNILGGDIEVKHDYTVDRKYREEILNSIEDSRQKSDDQSLINNYLKKTVR